MLYRVTILSNNFLVLLAFLTISLKDGAYIFSLELWNTLTQSVKDVLETATT